MLKIIYSFLFFFSMINKLSVKSYLINQFESINKWIRREEELIK